MTKEGFGFLDDFGVRLKYAIELPRVSEAHAQQIASRLNQRIGKTHGYRGGRFAVLNHYPSGNRYVTLIRVS